MKLKKFLATLLVGAMTLSLAGSLETVSAFPHPDIKTIEHNAKIKTLFITCLDF